MSTAVGTAAQATTVLIQPDGKIIAVGSFMSANTGSDAVLVRYNSNGTLDQTFGDGGIVRTAISPRNETIFGAALQPDGKIVLVGSAQAFDGAPQTDFLVIRFNSNGFLDSAFGNGGAVTINQDFTDSLNAVAVQPDGKIVAVGNHSENFGTFAVFRFNRPYAK